MVSPTSVIMAGAEAKSVKPANPKGSGETQTNKKKKKNAPDRPQPAWLFPPDEENPVLNPKQKSQEQLDKEVSERLEAIKFLRHKAVTAPVKPAPPTMLLTLIGGFLTSYGFNSTGRLFTLERNARKRLDGWDDEIGAKIPKAMPDLVKIYKQWYKDWQDAKADDDSDKEVVASSVEKASGPTKSDKESNKTIEPVEETSSSGSDSGIHEDYGPKVNGKKQRRKSPSTSTSESDADDEKGITKAPSPQPKVERFGKGLKRKTVEETAQSISESDSDFDSDSDRAARARKKQRNGKENEAIKERAKNTVSSAIQPKQVNEKLVVATKAKSALSSDSASSSCSESSSSNESDAVATTNTNGVTTGATAPLPSLSNRTSSADSSTTMDAIFPTKPEVQVGASDASPSSSSNSSSSSSSSSSPAPLKITNPRKASKRKRSISPNPVNTTKANDSAIQDAPAVKSNAETSEKTAKRAKKDKSIAKTSVPFKRIPENQVIDPRLASNAYVPYDYAHKAHEDLSVTKGKGFTMEKNKKKRGA